MICMNWIKHDVFLIQKHVPNKAILQTTIKCLALCVTTLLELPIYFAFIDQFSFMIKLKCYTLQLFEINDITNATLVT
jgi:hypothetical protein